VWRKKPGRSRSWSGTASAEVADFLVGFSKHPIPAEARGEQMTAHEISSAGTERFTASTINPRNRQPHGNDWQGAPQPRRHRAGTFRLLERALAARRKTLSVTTMRQSASNLAALGSLELADGRFDKAQSYYDAALAMNERLFGKNPISPSRSHCRTWGQLEKMKGDLGGRRGRAARTSVVLACRRVRTVLMHRPPGSASPARRHKPWFSILRWRSAVTELATSLRPGQGPAWIARERVRCVQRSRGLSQGAGTCKVVRPGERCTLAEQNSTHADSVREDVSAERITPHKELASHSRALANKPSSRSFLVPSQVLHARREMRPCGVAASTAGARRLHDGSIRVHSPIDICRGLLRHATGVCSQFGELCPGRATRSERYSADYSRTFSAGSRSEARLGPESRRRSSFSRRAEALEYSPAGSRGAAGYKGSSRCCGRRGRRPGV